MIHRQDPQGRVRIRSRSVTAKVWAIVLAVSDTPEQSISEVARRAGLPVSTTHRLLYELVEGGLLERNPDGRFTVCVELQQLLGPGKRAAHARAVVGSVLEDLCLATRLRARFGVWHPDGVSYLERRPDIRRDMCVSGRRLVPTHATALGKAMLAHAPPHVIANIVERGLPAYTPLTLTTPEQLHKDLIRTRQAGLLPRAASGAPTNSPLRCRYAARTAPWLAHWCSSLTSSPTVHARLVQPWSSPRVASRVNSPQTLPSSRQDQVTLRSRCRADPTDAALSWRVPEEVG
jgi:DNA-binding IclR family transcriptional regulator